MVRLFLGKAKSGKTSAIFQEMKASIEAGSAHEIMLIVPEQYTLEAEKQLIKAIETKGFLGVEVVSIKRLAHQVLKETRQFDKVKITETGKQMLLRNLFTTNRDLLKIYQNAFDKAGFLTRFLDLIKEFKQSQMTPEHLEEAAEKLEPSSILKQKLNDICTIMRAYEAAKSTAYFDDEDLYEALIEGIDQSEKIKGMTLYIDGFDSFTAQEHAVIQALAQRCKNLTVSLALDGEDTPYTCFKHTQRTFDRIAEGLVHFETKSFDGNYLWERQHALALQVMQYPYVAHDVNDGRIKGFAAANRENEVAHCCVEILKCMERDGYAYKDIAVVTNALDAYEATVTRLFELYDIPFFLDAKVGVMDNPFVHFVLSLLKAPMVYRQLQSVLMLLKTGFAPFEDAEVYAFEFYIKQNGVTLSQLFKPFEKPPTGQVSLEALDAIRATVATWLEPLYKLSKKQPSTVSTYVKTLYDVLLDADVYVRIQDLVAQFELEAASDKAQAFGQIWNAFIQLIDEMVALMGEERMAYDAFVQLVETGLETVEIGKLPLDENTVLVGSMDRSKAHPIKVLFLLGVNDGVLPESGGQAQLIQETEKQLLNQSGASIIADQKMFLDKEAFNLYTTLTRPSERLYLSYATSDSEGRTLRPSYLVSKMEKIDRPLAFEPDRRALVDDAGKPYWVYGKAATYRHLAVVLRKWMDGYEVDPHWFDVLAWFEAHEPTRYNLLITALRHDNSVGRLDGKQVASIYPTPLRTSVSRLETYVQCPFKFFVQTGLKPEVLKPYKVAYPDVGVLFHGALENFGKKLFEEGLSWQNVDEETCEALIDSIVDQMVDADLYRSKFSYQYMAQKLKRVSKRAALTLKHHLMQGGFEPKAFELAFGQGAESVPPIVIELSNGHKIFLRGVIDRIDIMALDDGHYIKIIDYKSGSKSLSLTDIYYGLQMQLMVYLKASLGQPSYFRANAVYPAGAYYFKIDDPLIESTAQVREVVAGEVMAQLKMDGLSLDTLEVLEQLDGALAETGKSDVIKVKFKTDGTFTKDSKVVNLEQFNALMLWVEETVRTIGTAILDGDMRVDPCQLGNFTSCDYCTYSALCQFDLSFEGSGYRRLETLDDETVLDIITQKEAKDHVDQ